MINNKKFLMLPPKDGRDFKEIFRAAAASGAGRQLTGDGFSPGPWTPDLLADAITAINTNKSGVDLRTVQLWFQDNKKGVSSANIIWLARIFGCDDPEITAQWQIELSASQSRLTKKRRIHQIQVSKRNETQEEIETEVSDLSNEPIRSLQPRPKNSLSMVSEKLFTSPSRLDLPGSIFAGATALGFTSYIAGIHNVTYSISDTVEKQVGFLWAPNWTILFMVLLPLFTLSVTDLAAYWKFGGKMMLYAGKNQNETRVSWDNYIYKTQTMHVIVFIVCVFFAGILQWIGTRLLPILKDSEKYVPDWGLITSLRPEIISKYESIFFTGIAYIYMSVCFYIFFCGLIIAHAVTNDFHSSIGSANIIKSTDDQRNGKKAAQKVTFSIFKISVLGVMIAITMKAQSAYLTSASQNILEWITEDIKSAFQSNPRYVHLKNYTAPTHYSSLVVVLGSLFVFIQGIYHIKPYGQGQYRYVYMVLVISLLVASYLSIGTFVGFSILLLSASIIALFSLLNPSFGFSPMSTEVSR